MVSACHKRGLLVTWRMALQRVGSRTRDDEDPVADPQLLPYSYNRRCNCHSWGCHFRVCRHLPVNIDGQHAVWTLTPSNWGYWGRADGQWHSTGACKQHYLGACTSKSYGFTCLHPNARCTDKCSTVCCVGLHQLLAVGHHDSITCRHTSYSFQQLTVYQYTCVQPATAQTGEHDRFNKLPHAVVRTLVRAAMLCHTCTLAPANVKIGC